MSKSKKWKVEWSFFLGTDGGSTMKYADAVFMTASRVFAL